MLWRAWPLALFLGPAHGAVETCEDFNSKIHGSPTSTEDFCSSVGKSGWQSITQSSTAKPRQSWRKPYVQSDDLKVFCYNNGQTLYSTTDISKLFATDNYLPDDQDLEKFSPYKDEASDREAINHCKDGSYTLGLKVIKKHGFETEYCFENDQFSTKFAPCVENSAAKDDNQAPALHILNTVKKNLFAFTKPLESSSYRKRKIKKAIQYGQNLPVAQSRPAHAVFQNELWICGGKADNTIDEPYKNCWAYSQDQSKTAGWRNKPSIIFNRFQTSLANLNDEKLMVIGGKESWIKDMRSTEVFDPKVGKWERGNLLNYGRNSHCSVNFQGTIFVIGGKYGSLNVPFTEKYVPETGMWEVIGDFPNGGVHHHSCLVYQGKIYVVGGNIETVQTKKKSGYKTMNKRFLKSSSYFYGLDEFERQMEEKRRSQPVWRTSRRKLRYMKRRSVSLDMTALDKIYSSSDGVNWEEEPARLRTARIRSTLFEMNGNLYVIGGDTISHISYRSNLEKFIFDHGRIVDVKKLKSSPRLATTGDLVSGWLS